MKPKAILSPNQKRDYGKLTPNRVYDRADEQRDHDERDKHFSKKKPNV